MATLTYAESTPIVAIAPIGTIDQVSDSLLNRYADLIYARTGIRVSPQKKTLLSNRLRRRLRSTGIESFERYYVHLKGLPDHDPEWNAFIQEITTHETFLFRDKSQWDWFQNEFLPNLTPADHQGIGAPSLRIWSAACSTGDEPFTMACCIAGRSELSRWHVRILATDIGVGALQQAKAGVFGERAMRLVPPTDRRRFFVKVPNAEAWQALPELSKMITFAQHNLLEPLHERAYDLVFLKNVLIYFNAQSKATAIRNICQAVRPGGWLVTGMAEGAVDFLREFRRVRPWLYQKPVPQGKKS